MRGVKILIVILLAIVLVISIVSILYTHKKREVDFSMYLLKARATYDKTTDSLDSLCHILRSQELAKRGYLILYYNSTEYMRQIAIDDYGVYVQPIVDRNFRTRTMQIMDSAIKVRYGEDFISVLEKKADSLVQQYGQKSSNINEMYGFATKEPILACGYDSLKRFLIWHLMRHRVLPLNEYSCCPNEVIIDFIIDEEGELSKPRILIGINPTIDGLIIDYLSKIPFKWIPANIDGRPIKYRKKIWLLLDNKSISKYFHLN